MDTNHMAIEIDLECDLPMDPRWGSGVPLFLITSPSKTHQPLFEIPDSFPAQLLTLLEGKGESWFLSAMPPFSPGDFQFPSVAFLLE